MAKLALAVLASYRDERLKVVKPNTVKHELGVLSSVINTAIIEWGIPISSNPVPLVALVDYRKVPTHPSYKVLI